MLASFIPMTFGNWNSLPASVFPSWHNLQTFKRCIRGYVWLRPNTWNWFLFVFSWSEGSFRASRFAHFIASISLKKGLFWIDCADIQWFKQAFVWRQAVTTFAFVIGSGWCHVDAIGPNGWVTTLIIKIFNYLMDLSMENSNI